MYFIIGACTYVHQWSRSHSRCLHFVAESCAPLFEQQPCHVDSKAKRIGINYNYIVGGGYTRTDKPVFFDVVFSLLCLTDKCYSGTPSFFGFYFHAACFSCFRFHLLSLLLGPIVCIDSVHMMRSTFKLFASCWICLKCLTTHDNSILVWNVWTSLRRPLVPVWLRTKIDIIFERDHYK